MPEQSQHGELISSLNRIDGHVESLRKEHSESLASLYRQVDTGLTRVHSRIDDLARLAVTKEDCGNCHHRTDQKIEAVKESVKEKVSSRDFRTVLSTLSAVLLILAIVSAWLATRGNLAAAIGP